MRSLIVVVDDERNILNLFHRILTVPEMQKIRSGDVHAVPIDAIDVHTYESAEEALASGDLLVADVVISDLAMDGMDGMEFLQRSRELRMELPFIILTGVGTIDDAVESIKIGAFDFVTKPFQRDEILLSISKAINFTCLQKENRNLKRQLLPPEEVAERSSSELTQEPQPPTKDEIMAPKAGYLNITEGQMVWFLEQLDKGFTMREVIEIATQDVVALLIDRVLERCGGNRTEAAKKLGISRTALYNRMRECGRET